MILVQEVVDLGGGAWWIGAVFEQFNRTPLKKSPELAVIPSPLTKAF